MSNKTIFTILGLAVIVAVTIVFVSKDNQEEEAKMGFLSRTFNVIVSTTEAWVIPSNWTTSTDFSTSPSSDYTTTTIYAYKRSIYRPTSSDDAMWVASSTTAGEAQTGVGTPSKILHDAKGDRRSAEICWISGGVVEIFKTNVTTTDMLYGRGIPIPATAGLCYTIDSDNLWQGSVWGISYSTSNDPGIAPSIISVTEAK